jgi:hypothetical protein
MHLLCHNAFSATYASQSNGIAGFPYQAVGIPDRPARLGMQAFLRGASLFFTSCEPRYGGLVVALFCGCFEDGSWLMISHQ